MTSTLSLNWTSPAPGRFEAVSGARRLSIQLHDGPSANSRTSTGTVILNGWDNEAGRGFADIHDCFNGDPLPDWTDIARKGEAALAAGF